MKEGLLLIDKPIGPTSHLIVNKIRGLYNIKKVGHMGTLDPMASGLLVMAVGRKATKLSNEFSKHDKEYEFTLTLGEFRDTDDAEGKVLSTHNVPSNFIEEIKTILPKFIGNIEQTPPTYCAKKVDGRALYKWARDGEVVEIKSRIVTIYDLRILGFKNNSIDMYMKCGTGTYVRSVCRDIGKLLNSGGFASKIRRTSCGEFDVKNAYTIDKIDKMDLEERESILVPIP